jgi:hypothetical protein
VKVCLLSFAPLNPPVRIRMGRDELVLSHELASSLFVEELAFQGGKTLNRKGHEERPGSQRDV